MVGLLAVSGCGPRTDRLKITGEVILNGVPLDNGSIRFTLVESESVLTSGALIDHGKYRIPKEKGLLPGKYLVEINAADSSAPPVMARATPGGPAIPVAAERIPPEYNINSTQTVEVAVDSDNHFVFEISSLAAK